MLAIFAGAVLGTSMAAIIVVNYTGNEASGCLSTVDKRAQHSSMYLSGIFQLCHWSTLVHCEVNKPVPVTHGTLRPHTSAVRVEPGLVVDTYHLAHRRQMRRPHGAVSACIVGQACASSHFRVATRHGSFSPPCRHAPVTLHPPSANRTSPNRNFGTPDSAVCHDGVEGTSYGACSGTSRASNGRGRTGR